MVTIFIIIGAITLIIGLSLVFWGENKTDNLCGYIIFGLSIASFFIVFSGICNIKQPTALDVYRGRTTLEITYKDSVAIDSVVVFKKK